MTNDVDHEHDGATTNLSGSQHRPDDTNQPGPEVPSS